MAHPEQRTFIKNVVSLYPHYFSGKSVIEIGSLNINGTVRDFFVTDKYVGVDVAEGHGVDLVAEGQELDFADNSFDVAISAECFEHNPYWAETFQNMYRMAKDLVIFTCASTGRAEHGTSATTPADSPLTLEWNYYRNLTEQDFRNLFDFDSMFTEYMFEYNAQSCDLYFVGLKQVQ